MFWSKSMIIQSHYMTLNTQHFKKGMQAGSNCTICFKEAMNAVNCSNQVCNKLFCLRCYRYIIKGSDPHQIKCPFCRISPFVFKITTDRERINSKKVQCPQCSKVHRFDQTQNHQKNQCRMVKIECKICRKKMTKKQIVEHTKVKHPNKLEQAILKYHSEKNPMLKPEIVLKENKEKKEIKEQIQKGQEPMLGKTGKFYCKNKLGPPNCMCCNGYCGPTNGENCVSCMKLDQMRLGLSKGQLVNTGGRVCWMQEDRFVCGAMFGDGEVKMRCGIDAECLGCTKMTKNMERYRELIQN